MDDSLIGVDTSNKEYIEQLLCDLELLFFELTAADGAKLKLTGINEIKLYIAQKLQNPKASERVMAKLCDMIDLIHFK